MGRAILAMFVGYIVALTAKGREMVATTTLGLMLCAMAGAPSLVWVAGGHDSFLWTLPWHCASSFAIGIGGAIVRSASMSAWHLSRRCGHPFAGNGAD